MPQTRGGPNKSKRFRWQYDPSTERVVITSEGGKVHTYSLGEIQAILRALHRAQQFHRAPLCHW